MNIIYSLIYKKYINKFISNLKKFNVKLKDYVSFRSTGSRCPQHCYVSYIIGQP